MQTKMIFLDIDGTLVDNNKQLPPKNKEAIDAALNMGHKVFICTGRPLSSVIKLFLCLVLRDLAVMPLPIMED